MAGKQLKEFYVSAPNTRPALSIIPYFLWGNYNFESDGDACYPDDDEWTELYVFHRVREDESVSIVPAKSNPLIFKITATHQHLAVQAAFILAFYTNGEIAQKLNGEFISPELFQQQQSIDSKNLRIKSIKSHCCDSMTHNVVVRYKWEEHDQSPFPSSGIIYFEKFGMYSIATGHDEANGILFCPWCATKLPSAK